jgi:hypothetical protein
VELRVHEHVFRDVLEGERRREPGESLRGPHVTPSNRRRSRGMRPPPPERRACRP